MALPLYGGGTLGSLPGQKKQPWEELMKPPGAPTQPTPAQPDWGKLMNPTPQPVTPKPPTSWDWNQSNPFGVNMQTKTNAAPISTMTPAPQQTPMQVVPRNASGPVQVTPDTPMQIAPRNAGGPIQTITPADPAKALETFKQDPLTEAGRLYESYVTDGLKTGKFSELEAARGGLSRDTALRSTQATEAAKQAALRAGAQPGTALYQSIMNSTMGEANRANMEQGNQVNALGRDVIQQALERAAGIEDRTYRIADTERAFKYGRADLDYERKKAEEAIAKGDQTSFLNSIEDTAVRSWAASQFAQGKSLQEISQAIWAKDPTTGRTVYNPQIASLSPGKQNAANILDYLRNLGFSPEKAQEVAQNMAKHQVNPITNGVEAADIQAIKTKAQTQGLKVLNSDELTKFRNSLTSTSLETLPWSADAFRSLVAENKFIKIGNTIVEPLEFHQQTRFDNVGSDPRHMDWIKIRDENGRVAWINSQGRMSADKPPSFEDRDDWAAWYNKLATFTA